MVGSCRAYAAARDRHASQSHRVQAALSVPPVHMQTHPLQSEDYALHEKDEDVYHIWTVQLLAAQPFPTTYSQGLDRRHLHFFKELLNLEGSTAIICSS